MTLDQGFTHFVIRSRLRAALFDLSPSRRYSFASNGLSAASRFNLAASRRVGSAISEFFGGWWIRQTIRPRRAANQHLTAADATTP